MSKLQREAEEGGRQVTRLQQQLDMCKKELGQCLHQVEGEMSLFRKEEEGYKQQVRAGEGNREEEIGEHRRVRDGRGGEEIM